MDHVRVDRRDGVARRHARRSRTPQRDDRARWSTRSSTTFDALEADESVGAVVITGEPPAFCSGADVAALGALSRRTRPRTAPLRHVDLRRIPARAPVAVADRRRGQRSRGRRGHEPRARVRRAHRRRVGPLRHPVPAASVCIPAAATRGCSTERSARRPRPRWCCSARASTARGPRRSASRGRAIPTTSSSTGRSSSRPARPRFPASSSAAAGDPPRGAWQADFDAAVATEVSARPGHSVRDGSDPKARRSVTAKASASDRRDEARVARRSCHSSTRDRVADVVLVHALDLQEAHRGALVAQPELLRDPPARAGCGARSRLRAGAAAASRTRSGISSTTPSGTYPLPAERLVDPVADVAHLERTALHAAEAHLAREPAVDEEQPEAVGGVEMALAVPRRRSGRGTPRGRATGSALPGSGSGSHRSSQSRQRTRTSRHASQSSARSGRSNTRAPTSSVMSRWLADRVEGRGILEAGKVAGVVAGDDGADRAAQHLGAPRLRQRAREPHCGGLERRAERRRRRAPRSRRAARRRARRPGATTTNTQSASPFSSSGTPMAAASTHRRVRDHDASRPRPDRAACPRA